MIHFVASAVPGEASAVVTKALIILSLAPGETYTQVKKELERFDLNLKTICVMTS